MKDGRWRVEAIRRDSVTHEIVVEATRPRQVYVGAPAPRIGGALELRYESMDEVPFELGEKVEVSVSHVAPVNA